ncbi:MAG TPA: bifunctional nicotinamidase/pyrazinamidase [Acidisarcina sp.]|nr:bifunctional nicotinamidase/pyrazinamidase [Acidisarcina sp.]
MPITLTENDVLLIVDVQNDFCEGGALAVPRGEEVVDLINRIAPLFRHAVVTQDWHPEGHLSFASSHPGKAAYQTIQAPYGEQILWPDHCVQGSYGAEFHAKLAVPSAAMILRKGFHRAIDSYSAFRENDRQTHTGLSHYLAEHGLERVFLAGLAYDYCVRFSALDARHAGFEAVVIEDACRAIGLPGSVEATRRDFASQGIHSIASRDLRNLIL